MFIAAHRATLETISFAILPQPPPNSRGPNKPFDIAVRETAFTTIKWDGEPN
jgi:hypothetical protein